jgi:hypothetical protein
VSVELERKVVEDLFGRFFWVTKGDIFELDDSFEFSRSDWIGRILNFRLSVNNLENSYCCLATLSDFF